MEFGEKLKKVREDKGMTQQTLANHLYVTRQAVSRWECGARYPDLLTAKKLSEFLDVSIDELVSGEKTEKSIEKRSVIEMPRAVLLQSALYAAVFLANLLSWAFSAVLFIKGEADIPFQMMYFMKYFTFSVLFAVGCFLSVDRRLTPKNTGIMASAYFFAGFIYQIAVLMLNGDGFDRAYSVACAVLVYGLFIAVLLWFYLSRKRVTPMPVYLFSCIWIVSEIRIYCVKVPQYLFDFNSDFGFATATIQLLGNLGIAVLLICQAYTFYKKKRNV